MTVAAGPSGKAERPQARLAPELAVRDLAASLDFYCGILGFGVLYDRPAQGFAYIAREGAEIMLECSSPDSWLTAPLGRPFGRGVNFQIEVSGIAALAGAVERAGWPLWRETEDAWYRRGSGWVGNRQFLLQDPDGYLLRFFQSLGERAGIDGAAGRVVG